MDNASEKTEKLTINSVLTLVILGSLAAIMGLFFTIKLFGKLIFYGFFYLMFLAIIADLLKILGANHWSQNIAFYINRKFDKVKNEGNVKMVLCYFK